jgi:hypothetical protein
MENMTEQEIKALLSTKVLNLQDKAKETILRNIIFSLTSNIDWQLVLKLIYNYMPEETLKK